MQYILNGGLTPAQPPETGTPYVEVLTRNDFDARYGDLVQDSLLTRSMEHEQHCKADLYRRYVLGTLHVPDKKELRRRAWDCGFYLDQERLLLDQPRLGLNLLHADFAGDQRRRVLGAAHRRGDDPPDAAARKALAGLNGLLHLSLIHISEPTRPY